MQFPFPYTDDNKRYHTWNYHLRHTFGGKVCKVALDAGFTCPNLDGARGTGGCTYCISPTPSSREADRPGLEAQFAAGSQVQRNKWPRSKFLAYFQARTNTYAPLERLQQAFEAALAWPEVVGLCIATRADALPEPVLEYLQDLSRRTWLLVELGLQTVHEDTARRINRCHSYGEFLLGYQKLQNAHIRTCVHLINGLPGESRAQMLASAREVGALRPHSVKLHMLHLLAGTKMGAEYLAHPFHLPDREEYVSLVCDQLELLPPQTVIQRLTGDPPKESLIAPSWTLNKRQTLNDIDKELARRNSWQGRLL